MRHNYHHEHTQHGYLGKRTHCGMLCEYKRAYTDEHYHGRYYHALTAVVDGPDTGLVLVHEAFGYEDGIVITLTEYECGQYYAHNVELYAQHVHNAQYPYPTHSKRQERYQSQFQFPERYPEECKHNESAQEQYHVEVIGK